METVIKFVYNGNNEGKQNIHKYGK